MCAVHAVATATRGPRVPQYVVGGGLQMFGYEKLAELVAEDLEIEAWPVRFLVAKDREREDERANLAALDEGARYFDHRSAECVVAWGLAAPRLSVQSDHHGIP